MTNPYAPPRAIVLDVADPMALVLHADRGTRLGAAFLDTFIFMGMVYVPMLLVPFLGAAAASDAQGEEIADGLVLLGLGLTLVGLVAWLWMTLRFMSRDGQSIGKKMLGIKVVRTDGSPVSLGRLIWLRNVVNWILSIVPLYGIIDSLFIFTEPRQCLHDRIADTIVVKA